MDEIISGVQVIKMYAWEKPFCALVEAARKSELKIVIKSSYIRGIYMTFNLFTTRMALFSTLIAMLFFKEQLTADKVFVFSSYFGILAQTMSGMFVRGFAEIAECIVAVKRLQTFLMYEEFAEMNPLLNSQSCNGIANGSISKNVKKKSKKADVPFIDDDTDNSESSQKRKQSDLMILASDLLKNTADYVEGKYFFSG